MTNLGKIMLLVLLAGSATTALSKPIDRIMDKFDTDGDGMVSADEFRPPRDRGRLERLDVDGDGAITMDEINQQIVVQQAEMAERQAHMTARLQTFFSEADTDGNGSVTQAEAQAAAFNRIDENDDGYLSAQELRDGKKHHGGKHDRGGKEGVQGGPFGGS
jgi:Ca2+-binding EF-hand superfamily protein